MEKVFKFGGASVKNADAIKNVKNIIQKYSDDKIIIVVSAMGKTTNALEEVYQNYIVEKKLNLQELMHEIVNFHVEVAAELDLNTALVKESLLSHIVIAEEKLKTKVGENDFIYDQIVSLGELFSTTMLNEYLNKSNLKSSWLDARTVLKTDSTYREGKVDFKETSALILNYITENKSHAQYIVTQGFIGADKDGYTTTLGREGSDYTAAIFAYSLDVKELTIWKDVPGILTADPKKFDNVEKLSRLSYSEAIEMTYYGAKVIHPKTIKPIQNKNIKLHVRSFQNPEYEGTIITSDGLLNYPPIVVVQNDMMLIQIFTKDFTFVAEDHLSQIFSKLNEHRIKMSTMRNSAISFTICVKNPGKERIANFMNDLGDNFSFDIFTDLQLLTVRYFQDALIKNLTKNKVILFEETMKYTIQLVVKPSLQLIEK